MSEIDINKRVTAGSLGGGDNSDIEAAKKAEMRRLKIEEVKNEIMTKELENIGKLSVLPEVYMRVLADDFTERPVSRTVESRGVDTSASDMNFFQASLVDRASSPGSQNSIVGTNALSEQSSHLTRLSKRATKGLRDLSLNKKSTEMHQIAKSLSDAHRELSMSVKVISKTVQFLSLALLLAGCGEKVELHSRLSEQEANEVVAELADKQIRAQKVPAKDGVVVRVNASDISRAVRTLEAAGLPKLARSTLGDIFRKEGVISTPLEERARYIYALSQELEATLSNIDGVIVARVHVVLPERIAPGEPVQPASASVFIKHDPRLEPDNIRPRVRRMVASSIPGMAAAVENTQKLTVVFVPAAAYLEQQRLTYFGPFLVQDNDLGFWRMSLTVLLIILTLAGAGAFIWRKRGLAWVRWWARPWETPACDWEVLSPYIASTDLCRSRHERVSTALAITPCLPPSPSPALLHLVQASPPQRDRMLTLIGSVCQPVRDHLLEEDEYLWCQRLAKALPADSRVLNTDDPLQYLRAWVEPASTWRDIPTCPTVMVGWILCGEPSSGELPPSRMITRGPDQEQTTCMLCRRKIELNKGQDLPQTLIAREMLIDCAQAGTLLIRAKAEARELLRQAEEQREILYANACREFWERANTQLQRWEIERQAICDNIEPIAASITSLAIRNLLEETVSPQRLSVLLKQLLATQVPRIEATLLCNPLDRKNVDQWLSRHTDLPWTLRTEENIAPQMLILETPEGGFRIDWDSMVETLWNSGTSGAAVQRALTFNEIPVELESRVEPHRTQLENSQKRFEKIERDGLNNDEALAAMNDEKVFLAATLSASSTYTNYMSETAKTVIEGIHSSEPLITLFEDNDEIKVRRDQQAFLISVQLTHHRVDKRALEAWMRLGLESLRHFQGALAQEAMTGHLWLLQKLPGDCALPHLLGKLETLLNQRDTCPET
eukprot:gene5814-6728_t